MTDQQCREMQFLIQADLDSELTPAEAAKIAAHLATCVACAQTQADLAALSTRARDQLTRHIAPQSLHDSVRAQFAATPAAVPIARKPRPHWTSLVTGFALAASLMLVFLPARHNSLPDQIVAGHIRALQPGHLIDVLSTDQHTLKPWFDGKLDFAPPVRDFAAFGFPLAGGRLDYLAGRPVAALIYRRHLHLIDVYVWPENGAENQTQGALQGYQWVRWHQTGMVFWAVSDLSAQDLRAFANLWRPS